jgi:tetratricopeptide (TPR) repeat protein
MLSRFLYLVFLAVLIILLPSYGNTATKDKCSIGEAEDFWKFNMKSEAINCLDKVIQSSPADTKAHFLKGKYCLAMGNFSCAEERFAAGPVREKYGREITEAYRVEASSQLNRGNLDQAKRFYWQVVNTNQNLRGEACKKFYERGSAINGSQSLAYFSAAREFCSDYNEAIGGKILTIAKSQTSKDERNRLKSEARKYVSQEKVDSVIPPPSWKTVYEQSFAGKGLEENSEIRTAEAGKDMLYGDKVIYKGSSFQIWEGGSWKPYDSRHEVINKFNGGRGNFILIKTPLGQNVTVTIERLTE